MFFFFFLLLDIYLLCYNSHVVFCLNCGKMLPLIFTFILIRSQLVAIHLPYQSSSKLPIILLGNCHSCHQYYGWRIIDSIDEYSKKKVSCTKLRTMFFDNETLFSMIIAHQCVCVHADPLSEVVIWSSNLFFQISNDMYSLSLLIPAKY